MKSIALFTLTMVISVSLQAQQNLGVDTSIAVPSTATARALTRLFAETTAGQYDPFQVMKNVSSLGDIAIPALQAFLFDTTNQLMDSTSAVKPNKLYAVLALDRIGTPAAYQVLAQAAVNHPESEVRGTALRAFALDYYSRAQQDSIIPAKEVVHLLLRNTEDTTYVTYCNRRIGDIAREGLKNWMGIDYGDILPDSMRAQEEQKLGMTILQYREQWWQQNSSNMVWNENTGHFEIKK